MTGVVADGPVEREILRLGHRGSAVLRSAGVCCAIVLGLVTAPEGHAVLTVVGLWSVVYLWCAFRRPGKWLLYTDTCVLAAAFLTQRWTVPPEAVHYGMSWVVSAASLVAVANQWHPRPRAGFAATVAVAVAYAGGSAMTAARPWTNGLWVAVWLLVLAVLSRTFYHLVRRGARAADRITADRARVRRDAEVAAARRADERAQLAALHDTAAATMLAIGTGAVRTREPWLAEQAARDLDVLAGDTTTSDDTVDLAELLAEVVRQSPVNVDSRLPGPLAVPAAAAVAICRSVAEALTNVARHAGVNTASLLVERRPGVLVTEVADAGRGFDPELVPPHRRGITLSIVNRMTGVGGRVTVLSRPGGGTRVRLEWPHD